MSKFEVRGIPGEVPEYIPWTQVAFYVYLTGWSMKDIFMDCLLGCEGWTGGSWDERTVNNTRVVVVSLTCACGVSYTNTYPQAAFMGDKMSFKSRIPDDWFTDGVIKPPPPKKPELPKEQQLSGAVRMFRLWRLQEDYSLKAIANSHVWTPGVQHALELPKLGSSSGFYGFNSPDLCRLQEGWGLRGNEKLIAGSFLGWGRIVQATDGGRIEYARIESIIEPGVRELADYYWTALPMVAEKYGVPIISEAEAKELKAGLVPYVEGMYDK